MTSRRLRVVIVDDEKRYRVRLAEKLRDRTIACVAVAPPVTPVPDAIVKLRPDAILVDYQLSQQQVGSDQPPASYLGSLLVAAIRERLPTTPIILVTRRKLATAGTDFLGGAAELDEAFDDLRFKEEVDDSPAKLRTELRSLVDGYRILTEGHGSWNDVLAALCTPAYAKDEMRRFGSPLGILNADGFRPSESPRETRRLDYMSPACMVGLLCCA